MADDIPQTLSELADAIAATRTHYADLRAAFEASLGRFVDAPADVADELLSHADEFGRDHALDVYAARFSASVIRGQTGDMTPSEMADSIAQHMESLLDTHKRLDDLTHKREKLAERDNAPVVRIINIQGQEFVLDGQTRSLHAVDRPDDKHAFEHEPELSLTEQVARDVGAEKAEPQPLDRDRDRTRTR